MKKKIILFVLLAALISLPVIDAKADTLIKNGIFTINNSTGNQSITGLNFRPKLVLFFGQPSSTTSGATNTATTFLGAATSSSNRWVAATTIPNGYANNSSQRSYFDSARCIALVSASGTLTMSADYVSSDVDGFTINILTASTPLRISYIAFGGVDISASLGTWTSGTGTGNKSITGVGFTPSFVLMANTSGGGANFNIGGFNNTSKFSKATNATGGVPGNAKSYQVNNSVISIITNGSVVTQADLSSLDSSGWTLNYSANAGSVNYGWIAIEGIQTYIGNIIQKTTTGNQAYTGFGFKPTVILTTNSNAVVSSSVTSSFISSLGAASETVQSCSAAGEFDGNTANTHGASYSSEVLTTCSVLGSNGTPTLGPRASLVSMDTDGITLNWVSTDTNLKSYEIIAFAPTSTPTGKTTLMGITFYGGQIN